VQGCFTTDTAVGKGIKKRDAHIIEAERNAAIAEGVQKRRDAQNLEPEKVRVPNAAQKSELANLRAPYEEDVSQFLGRGAHFKNPAGPHYKRAICCYNIKSATHRLGLGGRAEDEGLHET
jgi:hypothetical protein